MIPPMAEQNGPSPDDERSARARNDALEDFTARSMALFEEVIAFNQELANFISARIVEDIEAQQLLLHCDSLDDAMKLQESYVKRAVEQFSRESVKLNEIGATLAKDCFDPKGTHPETGEGRRNRKTSA